MAKAKKCICNKLNRFEDSELLLTNHHPECPHFNPASELKGLEMQCRHFMNLYFGLKTKVEEMQKIIDKAEEK